MAQIPGGSFDGKNYQKDLVVPKGTYLVQMIWSEFKRNKNDNGDVLHYKMRILKGEFQGVEIYSTLNFTNPSANCEAMGKKELEMIRAASGHVGKLNDTGELHERPMLATYGIKEANGSWPRKNELVECEPYDKAKAEKLDSGTSLTDSTTTGNGKKTPPWVNKSKEETPDKIEELKVTNISDDDVPY